MTDPVLLEVSEGVATVTLNRPKSLNALSDDMIGALVEVMTQISCSTRLTKCRNMIDIYTE